MSFRISSVAWFGVVRCDFTGVVLFGVVMLMCGVIGVVKVS